MDIKAPDPHIWRNNDAFDKGDSIEFIPSTKDPIFLLNPTFLNPSESTDFDSSSILSEDNESDDDTDIDIEIEEIEMEISRLSSKLKALLLRKVEKELKSRKKLVNLGFKEAIAKKSFVLEKNDGNATENRKRKFLGRDLNLGISEIKLDNNGSPMPGKLQRNLSIQSRQIRRKSCFPKLPNNDKEKANDSDSLGLSKNSRSKAMEESQATSVQLMQSRKKSSLLKIEELNEDKVTKQRGGGRSLSLSPESRLPVTATKRRLTTVGWKKPAKGNAILSSIQPKDLFKGGISVGSKKPVKNARVIASRYSQVSSQKSERRKWSLPGDNKENIEKSCDFAEDLNLKQLSGSGRLKKQWEIPSEVIMHQSFGESPPPPPSSFSKMAGIIPRVRITKSSKGSPRDSGPAKRVVDLVGRKTYFGAEAGSKNTSVCQTLSFGAEDDH